MRFPFKPKSPTKLIGDDDSSHHSTESTTRALLKSPQKMNRNATNLSTSTSVTEALSEIPDLDESSSTLVRFDLSQNQVFESDACEQVDIDAQWYKPEEYKLFKKAAVKQSKHFINQDRSSSDPSSYGVVFTRLYYQCCTAASAVSSDYQADQTNNVVVDSVLCFQDQIEFKTITSDSLDRMGLERLTIRSMMDDIATRKDMMMDRIADIQADTNRTPERRDELIQQALETISRPSRYFAMEKARALSEFCFC